MNQNPGSEETYQNSVQNLARFLTKWDRPIASSDRSEIMIGRPESLVNSNRILVTSTGISALAHISPFD